MKSRTFLIFRSFLAMPICALCSIASQAAIEQDKSYEFNITAEDLAGALNQFAQQSDLQIIFTNEAVARRRVQPLHGAYTPDEALKALLRESGLSYRFDQDGTIVIENSSEPRGERNTNELPPAKTPAKTPIKAASSSIQTPADSGAIKSIPTTAAIDAATTRPVEEVIVTGSRIQVQGFEAPTPVMVLSTEQMLLSTPSGLTDALTQLPQFLGTYTPDRPDSSLSFQIGGNQGSQLNLRGLGANRGLVLLDGFRMPASNANGAVDVGVIPELLISRVDAVTGGVSAVYGSDAVSGVVNYIINKNFVGVKGKVQGGITSYGDGARRKLGLAFGDTFSGDRGHFLLSFETSHNDAIGKTNRDWTRDRWSAIASCQGGTTTNGVVCPTDGSAGNPYTFLPFATTSLPFGSNTGPYVARGPASLVGSITDDFGNPIGAATALAAGRYGNARIQLGGYGYQGALGDMTNADTTYSAFNRFDYQVNDHFSVFLDGLYNQREQIFMRSLIVETQIPIFAGNPYIPAAWQAATATGNASAATNCGQGNAATALCLYYTPLGAGHIEEWNRLVANMGRERALNENWTNSWTYQVRAGLNGDFDAVGTNWKYDGAVSFGNSRLKTNSSNQSAEHLYAALDAVRAPDGSIVCNVTLTNPGLYPGCVPLNPFGFDVSRTSAAAWNWVTETMFLKTSNETTGVQFHLTGEPFSTWAGPVGVSTGYEYRHTSLAMATNADGSILLDVTGLRGLSTSNKHFPSSQNQGIGAGSNDVHEGNLETQIPLAVDMPFAKALSITGAVRYTNYATSGSVWTWKGGASWEPVDDVRFRVTRSRDIRAPSLIELYQKQVSNTLNAIDPHCNCSYNFQTVRITGGNPNLVPEKANTWTAGVVFKVPYVQGLRASVDFYDISLKDGIGSAGDPVLDCENSGGTAPSCAFVIRPLPFSNHTSANIPSTIFQGLVNAALTRRQGWDFELSYTTPADFVGLSGAFNVRAVASLMTKFYSQTKVGDPIINQVGYSEGTGVEPTTRPKLRGTINVTYKGEAWTVNIQERFVSAVNPFSLTAAGTPQFYTTSGNVPAQAYTDLTVSYDTHLFGAKTSLFASASNVFNKEPPILSSPNGIPGFVIPTDPTAYDTFGTLFNAGIRWQF